MRSVFGLTAPGCLAIVLVAACLAPPGVVAQVPVEGGAEPDRQAPVQDFFDTVDVEVVNIDVWVTDRQGRPVEGLGKDDFVVYEDGQPVEVTNFYAVFGGQPTTEVSAAPVEQDILSKSPVDAVEETASELLPEHRLWLIVYVDNYNIDPTERNRILPRLGRFLDRTVRRGDRAMIVTSSRSLQVRQPFTDDVVQLVESLHDIVDETGFAVVRKRDQFEALQRIDRTDSSDQALLYARQFAEEQMNHVGVTADNLERLIDSLAGLPGRKALVHVSSGLPMLAGEEMFHAVAERFGGTEPYAEIPRHDMSRRIEAVNREANANRVAFYTVDAGGLRGSLFGRAEYAGFIGPRVRMTLDSVVPENLQSPLRLMALETGGQAILNQNDIFEPLVGAAQDFTSFYSLGITAGGGPQNAYHEIRVKLRDGRRGWTIRHRGGYQSRSMDERLRQTLRSALLYAQDSNPLGIEVAFGEAERQSDGKNFVLPIRLRIPLAGLVLLPISGGRHEVSLELFVGAAGEDGAASEIVKSPFGLRLANEHVEAARKEAIVHTHRLILNSGKKRVGVAVLDLYGRQWSVITGAVEVGDAPSR